MSCRYNQTKDGHSTGIWHDSVNPTGERAFRLFTNEFLHTKVHPIVFELLEELKKIKAKNAYIVGGVGRDLYYAFKHGKTPYEVDNSDIDIEIHGVPFSQVIEAAKMVGKVTVHAQSFVVAKLWFGNGKNDYIDLSSPRRERYVAKIHCSTCGGEFAYPEVPSEMRRAHLCPSCGATTLKNVGDRHDYDVEENHNMTLAEAAERRDTTMNSMALSLYDEILYDPYNGKADIDNGIVRMVSRETFPQDELRFWRAARQASKYGFTIDREIYKLAVEYLDRQPYLDKSRVVGEAMKMFGTGRKFREAMDFLMYSQWFKVKDPERVAENTRKLDAYLEANNYAHPVKNTPQHPYRRAIWNAAVILDGEPESAFSRNCKTVTKTEKQGQPANGKKGKTDDEQEDYKKFNRLYAHFHKVLNTRRITRKNVLYMLPDPLRQDTADRFTWDEIIEARRILGKPEPSASAIELLKRYNYQVPPKIMRGNEVEEVLNKFGVHRKNTLPKGEINRQPDGQVFIAPNWLGDIDRLLRTKQMQGEIFTREDAENVIREWVKSVKAS